MYMTPAPSLLLHHKIKWTNNNAFNWNRFSIENRMFVRGIVFVYMLLILYIFLKLNQTSERTKKKIEQKCQWNRNAMLNKMSFLFHHVLLLLLSFGNAMNTLWNAWHYEIRYGRTDSLAFSFFVHLLLIAADEQCTITWLSLSSIANR